MLKADDTARDSALPSVLTVATPTNVDAKSDDNTDDTDSETKTNADVDSDDTDVDISSSLTLVADPVRSVLTVVDMSDASSR